MAIAIDIVVRTMADAARGKGLFTALDSIQNQTGVAARPIVVVNGPHTDDAVLAALAQRPGIKVHQISEASAGRAMAIGRDLVTAPYFGYLDDDDTLIDGSLQQPLERIDTTPTCDVMVTNGYFAKRDGSLTEFTHMQWHVTSQLQGLLRESWLQPGAFICRTATVAPGLFKSMWGNMEWTMLAFELCATGKRLEFLDIPTVRYNDSPRSLSKNGAQGEASVRLWRVVANDARFTHDVRAGARRNLCRALHNVAWEYHCAGHYRIAWSYHLASLCSRQALKYILFSRKLIFPSRTGFNEDAVHVHVNGPRL